MTSAIDRLMLGRVKLTIIRPQHHDVIAEAASPCAWAMIERLGYSLTPDVQLTSLKSYDKPQDRKHS